VQFPRESIDEVIKYMDPNGDGDIELKEMDLAVRLFNRKRAVAKLEKQARQVMKQLYERMQARKLSLEAAFAVMDKSKDGIITGQELVDGLNEIVMPQKRDVEDFDKALAKEFEISVQAAREIMDKARAGEPEALKKLNEYKATIEEDSKERRLSKKEIFMVRDYMDQEKDNKISVEELQAAFARAMQTPEQEKREEVVALVLGNLESYMKKRNMKLIQLFEEMDADRSGSLSVDELREALERMCAPTVVKNKAQQLREKKIALEKAQQARKDLEAKKREEASRLLAERMAKVKSAKSFTARMAESKLPSRPATAMDKTFSPGQPGDSVERPASTTPGSRKHLLKKLKKKPIVPCGICGGDKNSRGCQIYHQMVQCTISLDAPSYKPSPKAIGPFERNSYWVDPVHPHREDRLPLS